MKRITLVSMSGLRVGHQPFLEQGLRLPGLAKRATALAQLPPLGLLTVAGTIPTTDSDIGWEQTLISDDGVQNVECAVDEILESRPDVVAFSSLTPAIDRAIAISQKLRERGVCTMLGGLHATAYPQGCVSHFDAIACGDGERLFPKMLIDFLFGNLQPIYQDDGSFSIDRSPLPNWNLLGKSALPRYTLQTLRGCPWACSFCAASRLLGPPRSKSTDRIQQELAQITAIRKRPWIELADDNTFAADRDYGPFLNLFEQSGARWFTESDWRLANNDAVLKRLAKSGCHQVLIGIESNVFRYPGMGGKTSTLDRMVDACIKIQEHGVIVNACFIVGAEGETSRSMEQLGEFLESAPFGEIQLTLQTPFPGTSLYKSLHQQGRLIDSDFRRYTLFDVVFKPDQMTANELESGFHGLVAETFSPKNESRRIGIRKQIMSLRR